MITQETFTRGGKSYTANIGTDENGIAVLYIDAVFQEKGQPIRYVPEEVNIRFGRDGKALPIITRWKRLLMANDGSLLEEQAWPLGMTTNSQDMHDFTAMLWNVISRFLLNGAVRDLKGEKGFGYNYQPLFDATGARIPDTNYDTSAEPTNDYDTHRVDGTPINAQNDDEPAPTEPA